MLNCMLEPFEMVDMIPRDVDEGISDLVRDINIKKRIMKAPSIVKKNSALFTAVVNGVHKASHSNKKVTQ